MNQEKIKELEARIEQIKAEIDELKKQDEKWEPQGGDWAVTSTGLVINAHEYCFEDNVKEKQILFGTRYPTKEIAEIAAREMRKFNLVLAYKLEHCPYTVEDWVVCESNSGWFPAVDPYVQLVVPYMDERTADKLANDLNSGRVVL